MCSLQRESYQGDLLVGLFLEGKKEMETFFFSDIYVATPGMGDSDFLS